MTYNAEYNTGKLFGSLWKDLTDEQFSASVELFTKRALENKFDLSWIEGKKFLDSGYEGGRYSVVLPMYKAKSIDVIDVSKEGIELKKKISKRNK